MLSLLLLVTGSLAGGPPPSTEPPAQACQRRDFVNANSSPLVEDVAFTRNTDMADADFASPGNLVFSIRFPSFATLDSIRFENHDGTLIDSHDSVVGDVGTAAADPADSCSSVFTSNAMSWMDFKDALTLKQSPDDRDVDPAAYNGMHYRAEIVVQTTNKYDKETLSSAGVDAIPESTANESTRTVTSSFQLYFTLPQYVQAFTTITVAALPRAELEETIQMGDVSTTLDRDTLVYTSTFALKSKINWPYKLTDATATSAEGDVRDNNDGADIAQTKETATCTRTGDEDDEAVCEQDWLVTVTYSAGCEEQLQGTIDLEFTYRNVLPNTNNAVDDGTTSYQIIVSSDAIQCDVNAGDLDMTAELKAEGDDFQIGGDAAFELAITNVQTPGVSVTSMTLNEVGTTQDGQSRQIHYQDGQGVTGDDYSGDNGQSAVSDVDDGETMTKFVINLHQTLFNLDEFHDGSTENLLVDAQAEIGYTAGGGRRRRLLNMASRVNRKRSTATIKVSYNCAMFAEKNDCKAAKGLKCRWSKRQCRQITPTCNKLGPKMCKKSPKCIFKQKTKTCRNNAMKLKCADIANTRELCMNTPGCLTLMAGKQFKSCRGTVKSG